MKFNTAHIVVVGGGFAGIETIKTLRRSGVTARITLISKTDTFEYYPALYKLVTGALPIEVSVPLATIFSDTTKVERIVGTYTGIDQSRQVVSYEQDGTIQEMSYDYAVLAFGSETNYFNIPGLTELSFSFKSVTEALRLKRHFCELFANATTLSKDELVKRLHVVVVGGGPSGVELAGDLRSFLTNLAESVKIDPNLITIDLIEGGARVLPTLSEKISKKAEMRLRQMGVNIFTNRVLQSQDIEAITTTDMNMHSHTVIWTAGTRISKSFDTIPNAALTDRKRLVVSDQLSLPTDNHVFIAGDGAGTQYSGLAQTAIHNGAYIGKTIAAMIASKPVAPYKPQRPSFVIPIGNYWAIFNHHNFVMTGFFPWVLRSAIDFMYFTSIVPLSYVFKVFKQGRKYRRVKGGCNLE